VEDTHSGSPGDQRNRNDNSLPTHKVSQQKPPNQPWRVNPNFYQETGPSSSSYNTTTQPFNTFSHSSRDMARGSTEQYGQTNLHSRTYPDTPDRKFPQRPPAGFEAPPGRNPTQQRGGSSEDLEFLRSIFFTAEGEFRDTVNFRSESPQLERVLSALENRKADHSIHVASNFVFITVKLKLFGGMDTPARASRIRDLFDEANSTPPSPTEEEPESKSPPGEEDDDTFTQIDRAEESSRTREQLFAALTDRLLISPSNIDTLAPHEKEEVVSLVRTRLDKLWNHLCSNVGVVEVIRSLLWDYSELQVSLVDQRSIAEANLERLDTTRAEFDSVLNKVEALKLKYSDEKSLLLARLESLEQPRPLRKESQHSRQPANTANSNTWERTTTSSHAGRDRRPQESLPASKRVRFAIDSLSQEGDEKSKSIRLDQHVTVSGRVRSASEHAALAKTDLGRLGRFTPTARSNSQSSPSQLIIAWLMDWDDYVQRIDPTAAEAWKELGILLVNNTKLAKLLTAYDSVNKRVETHRLDWKSRIANLLSTAIPVNLDSLLKKELKALNFTSADHYKQRIDSYNSLLANLKAVSLSDSDLITVMEEAMGRSPETAVRHSLELWLGWKLSPDRTTDITFSMAVERIISYENANEAVVHRSVSTGVPTVSQPRQGQGNTVPPSNANANNNNNNNNNSNKKNVAWLQQRYGDLCPHVNCKHREKSAQMLADHAAKCSHKPKSTTTNLTQVVTLRLGVHKNTTPDDYVPLLPVYILLNKAGTKQVKVEAFGDSGSEYTLVSEELQESLTLEDEKWKVTTSEDQYLVKGVDSTGEGVICSKVMTLILKIGTKSVKITALIVPNLPERIVLGRDIIRETEIKLHFGKEKASNRIVSIPCQLDHPMTPKTELEAKIKQEMDQGLTFLTLQSNLTQIRSLLTFASASTEEIDEIFGGGSSPRDEGSW
jgi:hypothetical protein